MTSELNSAWQMVRLARESRRGNPRRLLQRRLRPGDDNIDYEEVLNRIDEGISHLRNMTRTMREATWVLSSWDERFRTGWIEVARAIGEALADPDADVEAQEQRLEELVSEMSLAEELPHIEWPVYGSMLASLRHIVRLFSDETSTRESRETAEDQDN